MRSAVQMILGGFLLLSPLPAAAGQDLPVCVHWHTAFVFDEFADHAVLTGKGVGKAYLANPDLCAQKNLNMGDECKPAFSLKVGETVSIGHVCGKWTYVKHETQVERRKKWISGWIENRRLKKIPPSQEILKKREEWDKHRHKNDSELANAIYRGDIEHISEILSADKSSKQARLALGIATVQNRPDIVAISLAHGARPDDDPVECFRLLNVAANNVEILRQLINAGWPPDCRVQSKHSDERTVLMGIASKRRVWATPNREPIDVRPGSDPVEAAKVLVAAGANLNLVDSHGGTALRHTLQANNVDVAAYLLNAGIDVNNTIDDSTSMGVQHGNTTLMEALFWYTLTWDPTMIKLLLEHGADANYLNQRDYDGDCDKTTKGKCTFAGQTVLTRAAEDGYSTIVRLLLEHGANPELPRKDGALPADIARENGHADVAALIDGYLRKERKNDHN